MEPHFFQLLDRIRYEASVAALTRNGKSLAIISPVQALAEHYKERLLERLALDAPQARIKPFFPADTDAIVSSFNKVVADLPLTQAMAAPTADRPLQVWVVHDAAALPTGEVLMMLDLLDKFPGAHVRALLVFAGTENAPEGLETFDKSLMRWTIERPSLEQIKDSLSRVEDPMQAAQVRDLISRMAPGGSAKRVAAGLTVPGSAMSATSANSATSVTSAASADLKPSAKTGSAKKTTKATKRSDTSTAAQPNANGTRLKVAALVTALLLLSAGVAAWLNPGALNALMGKADTVVSPAEPVKATEPVSEPAKVDEPAAASAEAPASPSDSKEPQPAAAAPTTATEPPASPEKVYALMTPEERKLAKLDAEPEAKPGKASAKINDKAKEKSGDKAIDKVAKGAEPEIELPSGAVEGQAWMTGFARGTFVVQHTNSETYAKARDRQKRFPNLSEAKVVPQFEPGQSQAKFALISGPFESKELADSFLKTENMPKESWVRSSRAIQKRLTPQTSQAASAASSTASSQP